MAAQVAGQGRVLTEATTGPTTAPEDPTEKLDRRILAIGGVVMLDTTVVNVALESTAVRR
jgi:hypothetical protein